MAVEVEHLRAKIEAVGAAKAATEIEVVDEKLDSVARNRRAKIKIDVDDKQVTSATKNSKALKTELTGLQGVGQRLNAVKLGKSSLLGTLAIPTVFAGVAPLVGGINALAAGTIGLVAPLQKSLSILGALPAVLTPAAAGYGVMKLATMGMSDAIKDSLKLSEQLAVALKTKDAEAIKKVRGEIDELTASMEGKFSKSALNFISQVPMMKVRAEELGRTLQPRIFAGANVGLQGLEALVARISPQLGIVSGGLGRMFAQFGRQAGSVDFGRNLTASLSGSSGVMRTFSNTVETLLDTVVDLGAKGQPVLQRLLGTVERLGAGVRIWSDGMTSGKMEESYEMWSQLWRIIDNTGGALGGVLKAFQPLGETMWTGLQRITGEWDRWTNSVKGQKVLKDWADDSLPVLQELGLFLKDFSAMWARLGNESVMGEVISLLRTGLLPALEDVLTESAKAGVIENLARALGGFVTVLSTVAGTSGVLTIVLDGLATLLTVAADLVTEFPLLGQVVANVATTFGLLKIIGVKGPIGLALVALVTITEQLAGSMRPLVPVITAFAAAWAAIKIAQFVGQFNGIAGAVSNLSLSMQKSMSSAGLSGMSAAFGQAGGGASGMASALGTLNPYVIAGTAAVAVGIGVWQAWSTNVKRVKTEAEELARTLNEGTPAVGAFTDAFKNILSTRDGFAESFRGTGIQIGQVTKLVNENTGDVDKMRQVWHDYGEQMRSNTNRGEDFLDNLDKIPASTRPIIQQLAKMEQQEGLDPNTIKEAVDAMTDLDKEALIARASLDVQADAFKKTAKEAGLFASVQGKLAQFENAGSVSEKQQILSELAFTYGDIADSAGLVIDTSAREQEAAEALTKSYADLNKKLDQYYGFLEAVSSQKDLVKSQDDLIGKLDGVTETLLENKGAFEASSEGGRANRDAVRDLYDEFVALGEGIYKSTGSVEQAKGAYGLFEGQLQKLADKGALSSDQMEAIRSELMLTEGSWMADFNLAIKDEQYLRLELIKSMLEGMDVHGAYQAAVQAVLDGKPDEIHAIEDTLKWVQQNPDLQQKYTLEEIRRLREEGIAPSKMPDGSVYFAGGMAYIIKGGKATVTGRAIDGALANAAGLADGGIMAKFANGGMLPTQAKIQTPRANLVQWAEPETGGEAFIPLHPSKRGRSLAIWEETGRRLGAFANGGLNNVGAIQNYNGLKSRTDRTVMSYPAFYVPPAHPPGGYGSQSTGGKGGSFQTIIDYINSLGIPWRNMGTWANRNVAGTNRKSLHAVGRAVDMGDPGGGVDTPGLLRIYQALRSAPFGLTELIYSGPGGSNPKNPITRANHHNHVHAAMADGGITPFAKGGIVKRPTVGLVGEAGPEAIIPLQRFANGGFSADTPAGMAAEAMNNAWEAIVTKMERDDPSQAIAVIYRRMLGEQLTAHSDRWTQFFDRISTLQTQIQTEKNQLHSEKLNNIWDYKYEKATQEEKLAMATLRQKDHSPWTNEWMDYQRRIDDLKGSGGPAVYVANATFNEQADIDAFNRSVSWAVRKKRL